MLKFFASPLVTIVRVQSQAQSQSQSQAKAYLKTLLNAELHVNTA